jgi:glucan biosynthesis protein C
MPTATHLSPPPAGDRRLDLDWIRVAAFALLILYHVGMLYVSWDFHVKSIHQSRALEALMLALNPWRLSLLFLVSGAATRFMLAKWSPGELAGRRSWRLLVPLAFGMLVIVPPQSYAEVVEKFAFAGSYGDFLFRHYLALDQGFCTLRNGRTDCIILPTWNHLWFVAYLWVYTMVLAALLAFSPGLLARAEGWVTTLSGVGLIILPALLLAAFRSFLLPAFPSTHALVGDWYNHALFGSVFLFGLLSAGSTKLADETVRLRWLALALAIGAYLTVLWLRATPVGTPARIIWPLVYGLDQWCWIIAILGFARRWLAKRDGPVLRYLAGAVFAYYIVHQTVIILVAHHLKPLALPAGIEAPLVIMATAIACALTYELARRLPPLRPLFGITSKGTADQGKVRLSPSPR